jgi:DNA-binding transcriptional ArsR family regulator
MDGRDYTGSDLARHLGVRRSTASEHLSKLLDAGVVAMDAQGRRRRIHYSFEPDRGVTWDGRGERLLDDGQPRDRRRPRPP